MTFKELEDKVNEGVTLYEGYWENQKEVEYTVLGRLITCVRGKVISVLEDNGYGQDELYVMNYRQSLYMTCRYEDKWVYHYPAGINIKIKKEKLKNGHSWEDAKYKFIKIEIERPVDKDGNAIEDIQAYIDFKKQQDIEVQNMKNDEANEWLDKCKEANITPAQLFTLMNDFKKLDWSHRDDIEKEAGVRVW